MFVENQFRNPDGNPYLWDMVVLETVLAEPNIKLYLNTDVHEVEADGPEDARVIRSVTGWMMGSERKIRFESSLYLDCTGDGLIGFLAGAKYRIGREAKHEYQEDWAPDLADKITLGSTILFYTKDVGHPVKYVPPDLAKDITTTTIPMKRVIRSGDSGCHYWWIEWGGELDTVHENERIRDELWSVIYGIWDYIKNSGKFEAENLTLEWVGSIPGKREYRRFIGDYVLNQNDIVAQKTFEDAVAFGGWSIDLHPPQGMYAVESGSKHQHVDGSYHIPFRSLYSVNVNNMLMAGRNISATHVAFGTTRVMATCAVIGEAAGTGAALCVQKQITPRELYQQHCQELQQTLLRQSAALIGISNQDAQDKARRAKCTASSTLTRLAVDNPVKPKPLTEDCAVLFPVDPGFDSFELLASVSEPTTLQVELWDTGKPHVYFPVQQRASESIQLNPGEKQWINCQLSWKPEKAQNGIVVIRANEQITLYQADEPLMGVLNLYKKKSYHKPKELEDHDPNQSIVQWTLNKQARMPFCFRISGETKAYEPSKAVDGYHRPYGGPHMWASERMIADKPSQNGYN